MNVSTPTLMKFFLCREKPTASLAILPDRMASYGHGGRYLGMTPGRSTSESTPKLNFILPMMNILSLEHATSHTTTACPFMAYACSMSNW